jgi:hypothetical protein
MSDSRNERNLGRESRRDTEGRLMEEACYRPEEYVMRWSSYHKPVQEKDKEGVGANQHLSAL